MMRVGFDFDNTIVDHDPAFTYLAGELFPGRDPKTTKNEVKEFLFREGSVKIWQEFQFKIYTFQTAGSRLMPGLFDAMNALVCDMSCEIFIVSHRSEFAVADRKRTRPLAEAATSWIQSSEIGAAKFFKDSNVYFELTLEEKIDRIRQLNLDFFIDDLEEVIGHKKFPEETYGIRLDRNMVSNKDSIKDFRDLQALIRGKST